MDPYPPFPIAHLILLHEVRVGVGLHFYNLERTTILLEGFGGKSGWA
jgi:hypothetical protein